MKNNSKDKEREKEENRIVDCYIHVTNLQEQSVLPSHPYVSYFINCTHCTAFLELSIVIQDLDSQ